MIDISAKTAGRRLRSQNYYSFTMRAEENLEEKEKQQCVQQGTPQVERNLEKKVAEPRIQIGYFPINISRYSPMRQKSTAVVLMEAKCASAERGACNDPKYVCRNPSPL